MDGSISSEPNYRHPPTIQCYDCHDYHGGGSGIDDLPSLSSFNNSHRPQNIAFGFTKNGTGNMSEDPPAGSVPGYYENTPPYQSSPSTNLGADPNLNPSDNAQLLKTGGHYFKYVDPDGATSAFKIGDKLPCRDCHDPHEWASGWQAFFRKVWPTNAVSSRLGSTAAASAYMANDTGNRDTLNGGRNLCTACHGTSDGASSVLFSDISARYSSSAGNIVRPPPTVGEHSVSDTITSCVSCHKHNSVSVNCNSCHSYPGQDNSVSGRQLSPVHRKHVGMSGAGGTQESRKYDCEVCHSGYKSSHNGNNLSPGQSWGSYDATKVDIRFDNTWNPGAVTYATANAGTATAPGNGGTGTCAGLYCHGNNATMNAGWNGSASTPKWDNTVPAPCGACHAAGTALIQGNHPVHLDSVADPRGPGGIAEFSPALNCSDGTATGCHTAYGLSPTTNHANRTVDFRTSPSSGTATDNNGTQVCNGCHSTYVVPYFDNTLVANTKSGAQLAKESWRDNTHRLPCLTCHNNSGQAAGSTANTKMDGTGAWAPGIEKYWRASGHGYPSGAPVDNTSTTTVSGNVNQVLPLPCGSCHDTNSRHFGNTPANGNAWRLLSSSGYSAAQGLDKFCALQCHGGGEAGSSWTCAKPAVPMDHFWIDGNGLECPRDPYKEGTDTHPSSRSVEIPGKTKSPHEMGTNYMPIDSDIRSGGGNNFLCVTCHDPHGTGAGDANHWGRSFAGANETSPLDNVHMLRYELRETLCNTCHI